MALTNQSKQTGIKLSKLLSLDDLARALREEVKQAKPLAKESQSEYEQRAALLRAGWDMAKAGKNERYLMRAAGVWTMRQMIRKKLNEADRIIKRGEGVKEDRDAQRGRILVDAFKIAKKLDAFRDLPWTEGNKAAKQEANHKKRAGTDTELKAFFEAVGESQFRAAFLVAEFTGCRGEELGQGVRVEVQRKKGVPELHFFITGAKCDGDKKGLDLREVVVAFPSGASVDVQRRWGELAKMIKTGRDLTVRLAATEKQTAGQRMTQNFRSFVKKAGLRDFSAYSLRHRVSAQTKAMGDAENTATVLGQQTTVTQRHYGRQKRGGGDVSPVDHIGVNLSGVIIRGGGVGGGPKPGPAMHIKEQVALKKALAAKGISAPRKRPRL